MRNALLPLVAGLALAGCDLDGRELLQNYDPETGESLPVTVVDLDRLDEPPVVCEADEVLPADYQQEQAEIIEADEVLRLPTGHSPFASQPAALADLLLGLIPD